VSYQGEKTYLVDRWGERWDITQAVSIGFQPKGFQYGIGRNAFTPLDDSRMASNVKNHPGASRIIGISDGKRAQAYSVSTLSKHEIANSHFGSDAIAVGY
jgi:hypothetical protein